MATILSSDVIFATVRQRGQVMTTLRLSGITSFGDVVASVGRLFKGITTIDLRNGTQGWNLRHTVMLTA
ncbi:MAG: hypothetical protein U0M50_01400 [Paramuribaculum sp.]